MKTIYIYLIMFMTAYTAELAGYNY